MPFVWGNSEIGAIQLFAPTIDDAIEPDVVLKCVGAGHIVIVGVLESHNDACFLINLTGNRLEPNVCVEIGSVQAFMDRERKPVIGAVGARLLDYAPRKGR